MQNSLLWLVQLGLVLFVLGGALAIGGMFGKRDGLRQIGLIMMAVIGPVTLYLCWRVQLYFRVEDAVYWSRLMAGQESLAWGIGSLGLIAGSGFAVGALAFGERTKAVYIGAILLAVSWYIVYLHPTPHYVPMPPWADKLVWFVLLAGGAGVCVFVYKKYQEKLKLFAKPFVIAAAILALLATSMMAAHDLAKEPIDLVNLEPAERITAMGCLSCHQMGEEGREDPGGNLASVASRTEDVVIAFMKNPDGETAKELNIRENPTGEMAGVKLTPSEVDSISEALFALFEVKPPSTLGPGNEDIEAILMDEKYTCLACHTINGEGAPDGGLGGPLEQSSKHSLETLVEWLQAPTVENATKLKIRETPMGAMTPFALPEEDAKKVANWLKKLEMD